jgi:hypothetical protein
MFPKFDVLNVNREPDGHSVIIVVELYVLVLNPMLLLIIDYSLHLKRGLQKVSILFKLASINIKSFVLFSNYEKQLLISRFGFKRKFRFWCQMVLVSSEPLQIIHVFSLHIDE